MSSICLEIEANHSQTPKEGNAQGEDGALYINLSKTQAKKLKKQQEWLAQRPERRRLERLKKKAKKAADKQNNCDSNEIQRISKRNTLMKESKNKFTIVIDLDFNEFMEHAEMNKLVKQIGRIYATNRKAEQPCQLYLTSLHGKIKEHMDKSQPGYINWDIHKCADNYLNLFSNKNDDLKGNNGPHNITNSCDHIVYMSGDSENTLPEINEIIHGGTNVFVIGGLVDHNRHKGLCHKRAIESGVKTAKLPIDSNVKLNQRHVLSTFAVFEILLLITGTPDITWKEALKQAIPKRKQALNQVE